MKKLCSGVRTAISQLLLKACEIMPRRISFWKSIWHSVIITPMRIRLLTMSSFMNDSVCTRKEAYFTWIK